MNGEYLRQIVAEWLRTTELPELIRRESPRLAVRDLRSILAVVGPRRAGKTYYLYQMVSELLANGKSTINDILFVDFEDYRLQGFRLVDMDELLSAFQQLAGRTPRFLFLDEIQHVPDWSRLLRTLHNRRQFVIVVSGSNSSLLEGEIAGELRGRYREERMLPFSFREILKYRRLSFDRTIWHTPERGLLQGAFDDYLRFGGFPETLAHLQAVEKRKLLQTYYRSIFYRDILDRHGARAKHIVEPLMCRLLEDYAALFSISRFAKELAATGLPGSKRTIANYLQFLEEAFFVIATEKFAYSPRRRMMNPRKVYLIDTGFGLLGGPFTEKRGALLENVVALEFFRQQRNMFYFKERHECDFIIQDGTKAVEAWQVCWEMNHKNEQRELRGLLEATETLNIRRGCVLTCYQEETRKVNGRAIRLVPVCKWLLDPLAGEKA
jgi:hypothetical protein